MIALVVSGLLAIAVAWTGLKWIRAPRVKGARGESYRVRR